MEPHHERSLGTKHPVLGLPTRVHINTPQGRGDQSHSSPHRSTQGECTGTGGGGPSEKRSHHGTGTNGPSAVLSPFLPYTEEGRTVETDPQPKTVEPVHETTQVQNGDTVQDPSPTQAGSLGMLNRSERRVSPRTGGEGTQSVPLLPIPGYFVPFSGPPVWTVHGPAYLYEAGQDHGGTPPENGNTNICIPRRLAGSSPKRGGPEKGHKEGLRSHDSTGLDSQLRQVQSYPLPGCDIPGGSDRLPTGTSISYSGKDQGGPDGHTVSGVPPTEISKSLAGSSGLPRKPGGPSTLVQTVHETTTVALTCVLQTVSQPTFHVNPSGSTPGKDLQMVELGTQPASWGPVPDAPNLLHSDHRCVSEGMGSTRPERCSGPRVGTGSRGNTYQCARTSSGLQSPDSSQGQGHREEGPDSLRQRSSNLPHQPTRRHQIAIAMVGHVGPLPVVQDPQSVSEGGPSPRFGERYSGHSIENSALTNGVVATRPSSGAGLSGPRQTRGGPVRVQVESQATQLRVQNTRTRGVGGRRSVSRLEPPGRVRVPAICPSGRGSPTGAGSSLSSDPDRSILAVPTLVSTASRAGVRSAEGASSAPRPPVPTVRETPRSTNNSQIGCVETVKRSLREEGFSEEAATLAAHGRRDSTIRLYDSRLGLYGEWCKDRQVSPDSASVGEVANFLTHIFNGGKQVNTVRGYRTAIGAIHKGFAPGLSVSNASQLDMLIRAMGLKRPRTRSLTPPWDMAKVLEVLSKEPFEPMSSASLLNVTIKTAFLVAAASARRRSALHALSIKKGHLRWENHGVRLVPDPSFLTKTQSIDFLPAPIFLSSIHTFSSIREDKVWCPVRALRWYIEKTKPVRGSCSSLFIISRKPFTKASKDSISRWIIDAISRSSQTSDSRTPRAHDVRAMSTSMALYGGVPLEDILQAAAWRSSNSFISSYLRDVLVEESRMSSAFAGPAARGDC